MLQDSVAELRKKRMEMGTAPVPNAYQGVTKAKIRQVLARIDFGGTDDLVDCVFALLDNETDSWFPKTPQGTKFCDGASTAHLACHIGILQRGESKLDREGRDHWIKPLRVLGGIEPVLFHESKFIHGHVKPKSPYSSYRLAKDFKEILQAPDNQWSGMLAAWSDQDQVRQRSKLHADMVKTSRRSVDSSHIDLIRDSVDLYAAHFLPGYEVIYVDDEDGERISSVDRAALEKAGVDIRLGDAMPDVLLWNPKSDRLWVIEAVTTDGEVDLHKVNLLTAMAQRCGKAGIDFTTVYRTWKDTATRQEAHGNIAIGSYIWILADPAKQFKVSSVD